MSAALRFKQLLFIAAALALVSLGLVAAFSPASPARADESAPCVETEDSYTDWVNEGDQIRTEENNAPGSDGDLVRYVFVGETAPEIITPGVIGGHYSWTGGNRGVDNPPTTFPPADLVNWTKNTDDEPAGHLISATWSGTPGTGLHVTGNSPTNASWFYTVSSVPAVTDTDFLWQKQVRTLTEGVDCPPPVDTGKKVVVCKYVGTPPGTPDHIIVVSVSSLPGFDPETSTFPFAFGDAQDSIAIRYAVGNEQPGDEELVNCPGFDPGPDCEANPQAEGCPPVPCEVTQTCPPDEKKVVVCKYVGTPPGTPDHIIVVSVSSLPGFDPETSTFPFAFGDAQDSIAIRYAVGNEQPGDEELVNCPVEEPPVLCPEDSDHPGTEVLEGESVEEVCYDEDEPVLCPEDSDHPGTEVLEGESVEEVCYDDVDPGPMTCPEGTDKAGDEIPEGHDPEEFCADDDDEEVCPEGTDHADETVPEGETEETFCDDDEQDPGPTCQEDPTQPHCDNGNPGSPGNPGNGPTVKGAQASSPTAVAGTGAGAPTTAPAALVPSAINAGLGSSEREPAGNGGNVGLLGVATALLGAAMVGLTVRPRRRTGAAARART